MPMSIKDIINSLDPNYYCFKNDPIREHRLKL